MKAITRSWQFWTGLTALAIGAAAFTWQYGSKAMKIVNVDLKMSRQEALNKTAMLSKKYGWEPSEYQAAASFDQDSEAQLFIELECDGTETFLAMMKHHYYEPYTWKVRHFKEEETYETLATFTPDGTPYEFLLKLPETAVSRNLSVEEAQTQAEQEAAQNWNIDFDVYKLLEKAKNKKISGRVDHTFVYQRNDQQLGKEGHYRVKLTMSGNKLTEVNRYIHIPESFKRRYKQMRASNESIAYGAMLLYFFLYVLLGSIIGGFLLFRNRLLLTRQASLWAFIVSGLYLAGEANKFPLLWMKYKTSTAISAFIASYFTSMIFTFLQIFALVFLSFSVGEGLTRVAFPHHPQFWNIWSNDNAASPTIAGNTIAGYLGAIIKLGWAIATYLFLTSWWGWWAPASTLIDPNIVATYFPPLSSFGTSLFAGFREECLFRAIPLGGAAIIGRHLKKEKLFLGIAFIAQALIFGAAHANYTTFPAYFRVVEMFPSSMLYGWVYVTFGLLPAVIVHWLYDFILMSLPVFISQAQGMAAYKIITAGLALIPLAIVMYKRIVIGRFKELAQAAYNRGWKKSEAIETTEKKTTTKTVTLSSGTFNTIFLLSVIGIGLWAGFTSFKNYAPSITLSHTEAKAIAQKALQQKNKSFLKNATMLAAVHKPNEQEDNFVWQELGKKWYQKLQGTYLMPHSNTVRFVHFEGDLLERTQEYTFFINQQKEIFRIKQVLPEQQKGAHLNQETAHEIALKQLNNAFGITKDQLEEVTAQSDKKPNRLDWVFIFEDKSIALPTGKAYLKVKISGDIVTDYKRFIHVPEPWKRQEEKQKLIHQITQLLCLLLLLIFIFMGASLGLPTLMKQKKIKPFLLLASGIALMVFLTIGNQIPKLIASFNTSQPFGAQLFMELSKLFVKAIPQVLFLTLFICLTVASQKATRLANNTYNILLASLSGGLLFAAYALVKKFTPSLSPTVANYGAINMFLPGYFVTYSLVIAFLSATALMFLLWSVCDSLTNHWTSNKLAGIVFIMFATTAVIGCLEIESIVSLLCNGLLVGSIFVILHNLLLHKDASLLPFVVATPFILYQITQIIMAPYPFITIYSFIAVFCMLYATYYWYNQLRRTA